MPWFDPNIPIDHEATATVAAAAAMAVVTNGDGSGAGGGCVGTARCDNQRTTARPMA